MQDFFNNLDWTMLIKAFIVGGTICVIGQLLIDKTKLTPARILVIFVTTGAILRRLRHIRKISQICRSWRNSPLNRIWQPTCKRSYRKSKNRWIYRCIYRRNCLSSRRNCSCCIFWLYCIFSGKTKNQEAITFLTIPQKYAIIYIIT